MNRRFLTCCGALFAIALLMVGCSRGPSEEELKLAELEQTLEGIRQVSSTLAQARADVATAKATLAELEAVPERKRSEEQKQQLAELGPQIETAAATAAELYEDLQNQLQAFLTTALNDFPQAPATGEGLRMYSDEAIVNAGETVIKSGDYKKAIETLETAKGYFEAVGLTPYQPLLDKIANLNDWRYITQERFDAVTKGMTEDEVKEVAGVPYYRNVKEDEARGVTFWLYPRRDGSAAAVYFNKKGKAYEKKWEAVRTRVAE